MDDIAVEMRVLWSAVHQYVRGEDDAFRLLAERLHRHRQALARAPEGGRRLRHAPVAERIRGVPEARFDPSARMTASRCRVRAPAP